MLAIQRRKGTGSSARDVVASFGGSVALREWWQMVPPGAPHTFNLLLNITDDAGAPVDAAFVDAMIAEVYRTNPVRFHWRSRTRKGRRYGEIMVRELQPRHAEPMLAEQPPHRTSANMLRNRLSALMKFAMRIGMASSNPVIVTRPLKITGGGFHS